MKNRIHRLRVDTLTPNYFRTYLLNFLTTRKFKSNYIYITTNLLPDKGDKIELLKNKKLICVNDKQERHFFVNAACFAFHQDFHLLPKDGFVSIEIVYLETDEKEYKEYKKSWVLKNFNSKNNKPLNINLSNLGRRFYSTKIPKFGGDEDKLKTITLKTTLNEHNFRAYLFNYFRTTKFLCQYIYVLCKIEYMEILEVKTIGYKTLIDLNNKEDIKSYVNNCVEYFNKHDEGYHPTAGDKILITYLATSEPIYKRARRNKNFSIIKMDVPNYFNIPWIVNYKSWAKFNTDIIELDKSNYRLNSFIYSDNVSFVNINKIDFTTHKIELHFKDREDIFVFVDTDLTSEANGYRRYFESSNEVVYFNNSAPFFYVNPNILPKQFVLDKEGNPTEFRTNILSPLLPEEPSAKIGIFDFETFMDNTESKTELRLLSASFYINSEKHSVYRNNFVNDESMLNAFFDYILTEENNKTILYAHNSSRFDLTFILRYLLNRSNVINIDPLYKDGKFLSLKIKYSVNETNCTITLRDSLLILLSSLDKLCKTFSVETQKDIFPYYFPNKKNLDYIGPVPDYKFFDQNKVSIADYNNYCERFKNKDWCLEQETINYCDADTIALYQVIKAFESKIFEAFGVNIHRSPTAASLAMRVYRTKYLKDHIIPKLNKDLYNILVNAYFGGHVDLYIPESNPNYTVKEIKKMISENKTERLVKVNGYDINSLYPSAMKNTLFPTELLYYFKGDNSLIPEYKNLDNYYVILNVTVSVPDSIKHPILPIHENGRTIFRTGSWNSWYNLDEIKNAMKYNYSFKILEGFVFEKKDLFSEFVSDLYSIREKTNKTDAMNFIVKILLNSLYGKTGINPNLLKYKFISTKSYLSTPELYEDYIKIDNFYLVGTKEKSNKIFSNVAIAAAVTSYARINMSIIKNNPNIILLYSDTDSAYIIGKLPDNLVDPKRLGAFKLEGTYLKFIALGPKVYGTLDTKGKEIVKVKGFKENISLEQLESLLIKDSHLTLNHDKWFINLNKGSINIKMNPYDLKINDIKRTPIFKNNKFIDTINKKD